MMTIVLAENVLACSISKGSEHCFLWICELHSQDVVPTLPLPSKGVMLTMDVSQETTLHHDNSAAVETLQFLRPIAQESSINTNLFFRREPWSIEKSFPLLLHWTYLIEVTFMKIGNCLRLAQGSDDFEDLFRGQRAVELMREAKRGLDAMKLKLSLLGRQWVAADEYLKILAARELGSIG